MIRLIFSFALVLGIAIPLFAQQGDILKSNAIMFEGQGNYAKAALEYEKAIEAYKQESTLDTISIFKAGQSYSRIKQYQKALPFLTQCINLNYNESGVYLAIAGAYEGLKDINKAEGLLKEGMAKFPDFKNDFEKKMVYLYFNSRQYDKSINTIKSALESSPNNETYLYMYGSSFDKVKKYDEAAEAFEKLLVINPEHKKAITKLGLVYYKQTDLKYKLAKKRYETIKKPSRVDYHNLTTKLASISKSYNKALPFLEKAHSLAPTNKALINCLSISYKRLKLKEKENAMNALL